MVVAAQLFLDHTKYLEFETEVPAERWFRSQRKGLGYEAWLYAMIRVAKCNAVLQWGLNLTLTVTLFLTLTLTLSLTCLFIG